MTTHLEAFDITRDLDERGRSEFAVTRKADGALIGVRKSRTAALALAVETHERDRRRAEAQTSADEVWAELADAAALSAARREYSITQEAERGADGVYRVAYRVRRIGSETVLAEALRWSDADAAIIALCTAKAVAA